MEKKAKIIATLGPAIYSSSKLKQLVNYGVDAFRINFSHNTSGINKIISKIPVIGNIVIPKEVGEGLFGISFKMKGPKGNIKTTINPIRTLTPRFIQKIIDRNKSTE